MSTYLWGDFFFLRLPLPLSGWVEKGRNLLETPRGLFWKGAHNSFFGFCKDLLPLFVLGYIRFTSPPYSLCPRRPLPQTYRSVQPRLFQVEGCDRETGREALLFQRPPSDRRDFPCPFFERLIRRVKEEVTFSPFPGPAIHILCPFNDFRVHPQRGVLSASVLLHGVLPSFRFFVGRKFLEWTCNPLFFDALSCAS